MSTNQPFTIAQIVSPKGPAANAPVEAPSAQPFTIAQIVSPQPSAPSPRLAKVLAVETPPANAHAPAPPPTQSDFDQPADRI